jgi:thiamine kinase-like enzyme
MTLIPLEEIARRWVPGEGPLDLEPLSRGLVNDTFRVARAGRLYALRVAGRELPELGLNRSRELGLDRGWECRVLAAAASAGVAPVIHCCDPKAGILVADWIAHRTWSAAQTQTSATLETMARLLRRVHALPIPRPARVMSPAAWIAHYSQALARDSGAPAPRERLRGAAAGRLERLAALGSDSVLCHSDVHRHNVATGEHPALIDWEYAHVSDPFWDLAGWISNNDGQERFAAELLVRYLERPALPAESERLAAMTWLYDYVCLLWSELYARLRPGDAAAVAARARQLEERLAHLSGRAGQVPAN